jgi:hypothetical protein
MREQNHVYSEQDGGPPRQGKQGFLPLYRTVTKEQLVNRRIESLEKIPGSIELIGKASKMLNNDLEPFFACGVRLPEETRHARVPELQRLRQWPYLRRCHLQTHDHHVGSDEGYP